MTGTPLVPAPLYGLRAWTPVRADGGERLAGPQQDTTWPAGGAWLHATCVRTPGHVAPAPGCVCGIHAWHPSRRSARRVLAGSGEVPGIVEAGGAIEVHEEGFRAERARPYVLVLTPGRNAKLVARLAAAYDARVVEVGGAAELLSWCRARGLGMDAPVVSELLGPEVADARRRERRSRARAAALRMAAALVVIALLLVLGLSATGPPGDRVLQGRTGEIHPPK